MTKSPASCLHTLLAVVIVAVCLAGQLLAGDAGGYLPRSAQERAMNAAQQLRDYNRRMAAEAQSLKARGISGLPAQSGIQVNSRAATSSTIFFYENFEGSSHAWTSRLYDGAVDDLWHRTTLQAGSPTHSYWASLEFQMNYSTGRRINTALESESIDLTAATAPVRLLFTENYVTELGWDYCMVGVSTDAGSTWHELRGGYGTAASGDSKGWIITSLDLSPYIGNTVLLRFYFDTGDEKYNGFPGWFVDDIVVYDQGGTIMGRKFFDVNNNSIKDIGERGIKDWPITAAGPITLTTKTDYRGKYILPLPLGTYTLSETFQPNWTQTYPLSGTWTIDLAVPDTTIAGIHFGNYIHASFINGVKFKDLDKNGVRDVSDSTIAEWKIILSDTLGNQLDYDLTDSVGAYSLYIFHPGRYVVSEVHKQGWVQSYPPNETYTIDIPDLSTVSENNDFGNYYSPVTNSITGMKFNDRNRDRILDAGETGLGGIKIQLQRKGAGVNYSNYKERTTDSSGFYQFLSLPPDTYRVRELPAQGWWQSYPDSFYNLILLADSNLSNIDFGNYEIAQQILSGTKYDDVNGNGVKDSAEGGLSKWRIMLSGTTYFNLSVTQSAETDEDGSYTFNGVWPGSYTVSEVWRSGWRQTQPALLAPYFVTVGVEEPKTGYDFGNKPDSTFSVAFRSFIPESLALAVDKKFKHLPLKAKPDKVEFCLNFKNDGLDSARKILIHFTVFLDTASLTFDRPGALLPMINLKTLEYALSPPLAPSDSFTIHGFGIKASLQKVSKWRLTFVDDSVSKPKKTVFQCMNQLRLPMPNAINLVQVDGPGLRVGLGGPHSVVHKTYANVMKSLIERGDRMHIGEPRCLGQYSNHTSIKKQQTSLTPTKHNNRLFAEAIALKINIKASDLGRTPGGFGNLIFNEGGTNAFNGLSVREIAGKLDEAMSAYDETGKTCGKSQGYYDTLFQTIRKIDSAFCGPIDTFSFALGLRYREFRALSDVPFLGLSPVAAMRNYVPAYTDEATLPEQFTLYQNYPNPFNPTTTIEFNLPATSLVTLKVYNTLGQEVATVFDREMMESGLQDVVFNAVNLPSGVYFYRIIAEGVLDEETGLVGAKHISVRKMVLIK